MKKIRILFLSIFILSIANSAEIVNIKYRGYKDLADYDCGVTSYRSSFIYRLCYRDDSLVLKLKNTYYEFCKVPLDKILKLQHAKSPGRYFVYNIKGKFNCK